MGVFYWRNENRALGAKRAQQVLDNRDTQVLPAYAFIGGGQNFLSGLKGGYNSLMGNDSVVVRNPYEYLYQYMRPELSGAEAFLSDVAYSAGNTLPSMALGAINPALGRGAMMLSSSGNSYDDAISRGYGVADARRYGYAKGTKEMLLEKVLGSTPFLSDATNAISGAVSKYSDDVLRAIIKNDALRKGITELGGKMASGAFEEGMQTLSDPLLSNLILGTNEKVSLKDVLESAKLGGISAGIFNAPGAVNTVFRGGSNTVKANAGRMGALADNDMGADSDIRLALSIINKGDGDAQQRIRDTFKDNGYGDTLKAMDGAAQIFRKGIEFGDSDTARADTIVIDTKSIKSSRDAVKQVFDKELTEKIDNAKGYRELVSSEEGSQFFNSHLIEKGYTKVDEDGYEVADVDGFRLEIEAESAERGRILSEDEVDAECLKRFIADNDLLTDRESIERLAKVSPELAKEIGEWIKETAARAEGTEFEDDMANARRMYGADMDESYHDHAEYEEALENGELTGYDDDKGYFSEHLYEDEYPAQTEPGSIDDDLSVSLNNIDEFILGNKTFEDVQDDYARIYADIVNSNKMWSWEEDIKGAEKISKDQKGYIKARAVENKLIPKVEVKKVEGMKYGFADFGSAGLVKETRDLPEEMWKLNNKKQFKWLNEQIGGKREGYTWHHTEIPGVMQLVPRGVHMITSHNGGRTHDLWAEL